MAASPTEIAQSLCSSLTARRIGVGIAAGLAWGIVVAIGVCGLQFWKHGVICDGDIALTACLSIAGGLATMLPLAILGAVRTLDESPATASS